MTAAQAADLALGARLRAYTFDRYKTKRKEGEEAPAGSGRRRAGQAARSETRRRTQRAKPQSGRAPMLLPSRTYAQL